jgi:ribosome-associated protein|tara:strand:+ start:732 stop:1229 length:498 start_codon:yes stop_codon:yes gene_type:complete
MFEDLSKTARKREAERLQLVGRKLTEMKPDVLATIQLSAELHEAIATHQRISSREGGRRQLQFIGKLMRKIDTEALEKQIADLEGRSNDARTFFHQLEQWRDRLVEQPDTMKDFIDQYPQVDRQQFRQVVVKAAGSKPNNVEPANEAHKRALKLLFKFLRDSASD